MEVPGFWEKPCQTWQAAVKTFKKIKTLPQQHIKRVKIYNIDF